MIDSTCLQRLVQEAACLLTEPPDENPEYDRALVEIVAFMCDLSREEAQRTLLMEQRSIQQW